MNIICPAAEIKLISGGKAEVIRKATTNDLSGIVAIHQKAFGAFFLTRLGAGFLRKYYGLVLNYRSGIVLVAEHGSGLQGFACGFIEPSEFYQLMWNRKMTFARPVLGAVFRRPCLITKVLYGVRRIHSPAEEWPPRSCELSSIAVAPERAGNGLGKSLISAFLAQAQAMKAHRVYLTTDADENDAGNAFYRGVGFQHTRRFLQHERRWMNEYVINGNAGSDGCENL
jgi:ribosomal protein S18 acetylase RimI-like enzyme